ncbi:Holliday junction resolvase RuvX [Thioflexithrix psekupsensis]|uniref:Putative pre-16S rRNA nuclease n=1 Tax=Thioflexithrix psekupsensis TaxID=1570016 RepID=A0A251X6K5_9GAMM|nr:Holliday junction resolvase RuvX [Thioflexithrix psekupsensis]OUD13227.1 Holliday junction DNA helicase RuvA [Thioflexithrix psekupsensis]
MNHSNSTLLAFDYGQQRIGVAVGQTLVPSARPLCVLQSRQQIPDWNGISRLIQEWQPYTLIVGLPLHADGTEGMMAQAARRFARQLSGRYALPIEMIEETLSSVAASGRQRENAPKRRHTHLPIDAIAAQIILETWLAEHA